MALSAVPRHCKYDVFPSFHGEDVRRNLLSYLLKEFREKGIDVFIDNDMERSKSIGPELMQAIRGSVIAIVLISRNYASSTWCLNELVEIMKCRDEGKQTAMVIFHEVAPSDVRKQTGYFGAVFKKTCVGKRTAEVRRWKQALQEVAKIAGYHSPKFDGDVLMVETVATNVLNKLNDYTASTDFDGLVGVETHIREIYSLLALESEEVRMVGIWGPAGIGKTTIARALYRKLSNKLTHTRNFTHTAFIESIKGKFEQNNQDKHAFMCHLHEHLLSETLNQKDLKIGHLGIAKARLKNKKVLLVLDDVDDLKQLEAMASKACWFGPGSRIIITTKDIKILKAHEINQIYQVDFPSTSEALEILCVSAFRQTSPLDGFEDMAVEVTQLAGNLPLGLTVFGAYLRGMTTEQWIDAFPRLRTSLDGGIKQVLQASYDAVCDKDQQLFLHVACFFNGVCINKLVDYLAESRLDVRHGLQVLVDKSLIFINEEGCVLMNNLLEQLGKEIVRQQSLSKPGKRQFLVDPREICDVLAYNKGTGTILGIDFDVSEIKGELNVDERAFEEMSSLQFLRFRAQYNDTKLILPQGLKFGACKLRYLQWDQCPLTIFPRGFHPNCLVKLEMQNSRLEKLWEGPMPLPCLKRMDMSDSRNLKKIPDLSNATNLEELKAVRCSSLEELPSSIGEATSLQNLNLHFCPKLVAIPFSIGNAINLKLLNLGGCSSLVELPSSFGNITNLRKLSLTGCKGLVELPSSIRNLERLEVLLIVRCLKLNLSLNFPDSSTNITLLDLGMTEIEELPSSVMSWTCLRKLDMGGCKSLKVFPAVPVSIKILILSGTGIEEVPPSIENLSHLAELTMLGCEKLKVLPTNVNLESLSSLNLSFCTQLNTFPEISTSVEYLNLSYTAIEEVPSSILSWSRLLELHLVDCKSLQVFHDILDSIEELDLSNTETNLLGGGLEAIPDNVNYLPLPLRINLSGCNNLVSLPRLRDFVSFLDAVGCESLETIDGLFTNSETCLNFANCFKLSQEAIELIEILDCKFALLPGGDLPSDFDHRAQGDFLTVSVDQRPFPLFLRFKACLLLLHGSYFSGKYFEDNEDDEADHSTGAKLLSCRISCIQSGLIVGYGSCKYQLPALLGLREHLYFFESSISINLAETDVNFSELEFEFKITGLYWEIKGCGVRLLKGPDVHDEHGCYGNNCNETEYIESAGIKITENLHAGAIRIRNGFRLPYATHYSYIASTRDTRNLGACVLLGFLCIGSLVYYKLKRF